MQRACLGAASPDLRTSREAAACGCSTLHVRPEVVDLVTKAGGTVVHLRILPGSVGDYAATVSRATTPA
jgi:hypothetical protein